MFATAAIQLGELLDSRRGSFVRFKPGQPLAAAGDDFIRSVVKPAVKGNMSRYHAWFVVIWDYVNIVFILNLCEFFLWTGIADLLIYYIWPYYYPEELVDASNFTMPSPEFFLPAPESFFNETEEEGGLSEVQLPDIVWIVTGYTLTFISLKFFSMNKSYEEMDSDWRDGFPPRFGWFRKGRAFGRSLLNFVAYVFLITGFWDLFDACIWEATLERDIIYTVGGLFLYSDFQ
jgi:hypothetical protein